MQAIRVEDPQVLVLATGRTKADVAQARGALFERFVAMLLADYGYEAPTRNRLNVLAEGIEIDVTTKNRVTDQPLIAECKAYSRTLPAEFIDQFYGKVCAARWKTPNLFGWFVGIPRLASPGHEHAKAIAAADRNFRFVGATELSDMLKERGHIRFPEPEGDTDLLADPAVLITEHGVYSAAIRLEPTSRAPICVVVRSVYGEVPQPVLDLVAADGYANGVPVQGARRSSLAGVRSHVEPSVVMVAGSRSDFEYQLPASPQFFVGRDKLLAEVGNVFSARLPGVFVLNAQSGWGKSSFALRLQDVVRKGGGLAWVVDSRTATTPQFIGSVLSRVAKEAVEEGALRLGPGAAFSSLNSTISTFRHSEWLRKKGVLLVIFDQFENVFRSAELTSAFRDLAIAVHDLQLPLVVGFSWKTDLVGWTEGHPYALRDDIRKQARVFILPPFGAAEITTLLQRLEAAISAKLSPELKTRLREFSQGLPWLLKKLSGHVIRELQAGTTQEQLLYGSLNVVNLFTSDLAELSPEEVEALKLIARSAPVPVSDLVDRVQSRIIQSLLDRRLIVQVGERLDTYWDIFRDFLNTGSVPAIEETFILRQAPGACGRLLREAVHEGGALSVAAAASRFRVSENAVFNQSRDLRLLGVLSYEQGIVRITPELLEDLTETAIRVRVARALRRHRAWSIYRSMGFELEPLDLGAFAGQLASAFPAVSGDVDTWLTYAGLFLRWFEYAGLRPVEGDNPALLTTSKPLPVRGAFPAGPPGPAIRVLRALQTQGSPESLVPRTSLGRALRDLETLRCISLIGDTWVANEESFLRSDTLNGTALLEALQRVPQLADTLRFLGDNPNADSKAVGHLLAEGYGAGWSEVTVRGVGKHFLAWYRLSQSGELPEQSAE